VCNAKNSFFQKFVELSILAGESGVQGLPLSSIGFLARQS
jgi:hypothetical protein